MKKILLYFAIVSSWGVFFIVWYAQDAYLSRKLPVASFNLLGFTTQADPEIDYKEHYSRYYDHYLGGVLTRGFRSQDGLTEIERARLASVTKLRQTLRVHKEKVCAENKTQPDAEKGAER